MNEYEYGIRFPVLNTKLTEGTKPKAGDVIVFDHPMQPGTDLIKRVVGVPGDKVVYRNKILYINGVEQPQKPIGDYVDQEFMVTLNERQETLQGHCPPHARGSAGSGRDDPDGSADAPGPYSLYGYRF